MRVTHVITRLIVGGAQENTIATVLGLRNKPGVKVDLISGPTNGSEGSLEPEVAKYPGLLKIVPDLVRPIDPWRDLKATFALAREFRQAKPDIVHTHSGKAGIVGRLGAKKAGLRCVIHSIHGPSFGSFQGAVPNLVFKAAERIVAGSTTHFISVANAMTEQYLAAGIGRPEDYTRIFSGFALEPFLSVAPNARLRHELGFSEGDFVMIKVARLFKLKGHDDLFDAAPEIIARIPNAKFLIVGDGPWRERFEERANETALRGRFVFTGLVPPEKVPSYMSAADCLAHLSTREGLPRALSQGAAASLPLVAYDGDGAPEICMEGRNGFLIKPGDLKTLCSRLDQLARDPELRAQFGRAGREFARENFAVQKMVDDIYALYLRLLSRAA